MKQSEHDICRICWKEDSLPRVISRKCQHAFCCMKCNVKYCKKSERVKYNVFLLRFPPSYCLGGRSYETLSCVLVSKKQGHHIRDCREKSKFTQRSFNQPAIRSGEVALEVTTTINTVCQNIYIEFWRRNNTEHSRRMSISESWRMLGLIYAYHTQTLMYKRTETFRQSHYMCLHIHQWTKFSHILGMCTFDVVQHKVHRNQLLQYCASFVYMCVLF